MTGPHTTGVWISANSATMLRWSPELTVRHRIDSTVPGRHRSTGRAPIEERQGDEGHRDEHMRTFFEQVTHALPVEDDLLLVGDGEVVGHFAEHVRADDANHGRKRRIEVDKSSSVSERKLLALIRGFAGSPARRYLPR